MPSGPSTAFYHDPATYDHTPYETDQIYFEPDDITDEILWCEAHIRDPRSPVMGSIRLWTAVLHQAVHDVYDPNKLSNESHYTMRRVKDDAIRWFNSDVMQTGSYLWVCEVLDLAPSFWRKRVLGGDMTVEEYKISREKFQRKYNRRVVR